MNHSTISSSTVISRPESLVSYAERINAGRSLLLVSRVLGKHVPLPAALCRLAGIALALRIADDPRAEPAWEILLSGDAERARVFVAECETAPARLPGVSVIGLAETATGLSEQVATMLDADWFQTTTRQQAACIDPHGFQEAHSHARDQWLDMPRVGWPSGPVVIVDDELTTGATAARLIDVLHRSQAHDRYIVAALVDSRPADADALATLASQLGVRIDVIALERLVTAVAVAEGWSRGAMLKAAPPAVESLRVGFRQGARELHVGFNGALQHHGQDRTARRALADAAGRVGQELGPLPAGSLVLGTGEHLAFAQRCACAAGILTSSTTRSPVLVSDRPGYPIRSGITFVNPEDPRVPGFAYNIAVTERPAIVVHFQDTAHRQRGEHLLDALTAAAAAPLTVVTLAG